MALSPIKVQITCIMEDPAGNRAVELEFTIPVTTQLGTTLTTAQRTKLAGAVETLATLVERNREAL